MRLLLRLPSGMRLNRIIHITAQGLALFAQMVIPHLEIAHAHSELIHAFIGFFQAMLAIVAHEVDPNDGKRLKNSNGQGDA